MKDSEGLKRQGTAPAKATAPASNKDSPVFSFSLSPSFS